MKFSDYIRDKNIAVFVNFIGVVVFAALLKLFGMGTSELILLGICFVFLAVFAFWQDYSKQKRRIKYLLSLLNHLDQKYLIAEIADEPESIVEQVYFRLMKTALKAMSDEVASSKRMVSEYRDFVEQWVHEMKVPIAGIQLICENNKTDIMRKVITQAELLEQGVEKVLYYARSGSVEKDFLITYISLKDCIRNVLAQNKQLLIQNRVTVQTDGVVDRVYSDGKWIEFILGQIITNSIKYKSSDALRIQIISKVLEHHVVLSVTDNGVGIRESELDRVFDKGFTGSNGRNGKHATGMGLYICAILCDQLGITIDIASEWNRFTTVYLYFPKSGEIS